MLRRPWPFLARTDSIEFVSFPALRACPLGVSPEPGRGERLALSGGYRPHSGDPRAARAASTREADPEGGIPTA